MGKAISKFSKKPRSPESGNGRQRVKSISINCFSKKEAAECPNNSTTKCNSDATQGRCAPETPVPIAESNTELAGYRTSALSVRPESHCDPRPIKEDNVCGKDTIHDLSIDIVEDLVSLPDEQSEISDFSINGGTIETGNIEMAVEATPRKQHYADAYSAFLLGDNTIGEQEVMQLEAELDNIGSASARTMRKLIENSSSDTPQGTISQKITPAPIDFDHESPSESQSVEDVDDSTLEQNASFTALPLGLSRSIDCLDEYSLPDATSNLSEFTFVSRAAAHEEFGHSVGDSRLSEYDGYKLDYKRSSYHSCASTTREALVRKHLGEGTTMNSYHPNPAMDENSGDRQNVINSDSRSHHVLSNQVSGNYFKLVKVRVANTDLPSNQSDLVRQNVAIIRIDSDIDVAEGPSEPIFSTLTSKTSATSITHVNVTSIDTSEYEECAHSQGIESFQTKSWGGSTTDLLEDNNHLATIDNTSENSSNEYPESTGHSNQYTRDHAGMERKDRSHSVGTNDLENPIMMVTRIRSHSLDAIPESIERGHIDCALILNDSTLTAESMSEVVESDLGPEDTHNRKREVDESDPVDTHNRKKEGSRDVDHLQLADNSCDQIETPSYQKQEQQGNEKKRRANRKRQKRNASKNIAARPNTSI